MNKINKNVCQMDISGNSGQCAEKEIAMESSGEVWTYPQAKATSNAALAARVVELENDLSSHLHHAQAAQPFTLSDGMALCLNERVQEALADFGSRRSAMSAARLAYAVMTAHGQQLPAAPSAPEPCIDPDACDRQGCANTRGRCEEAAPASQVQEGPETDASVVVEDPPAFYKYNPNGLEGHGSRANLWEYGQLVGWRTGRLAAAPAPIQPSAQQDDGGLSSADLHKLDRCGGAYVVREKNANIRAHQSVLVERDTKIAELEAALAQRAGSGEVKPTDISSRLREYAGNPGYSHSDYADTMRAAAEEIERYYGGMLAWKKTASKKDADYNAERMARIDDRIAARAAKPDSECSGLAAAITWNSALDAAQHGLRARVDSDEIFVETAIEAIESLKQTGAIPKPDSERDSLVPSLKLSQVVEAQPSGCHSVQLIMESSKEAKLFCDSVNAAISSQQVKGAVKS